MSWLEERVSRRSVAPLLALPEALRGAQISKLPSGGIQDVVTEYLKDFWNQASQGIAPVFIGRARQGKTFAAACIAREANRQGFVEVEWMNGPFDSLALDMQKYTIETTRRVKRLSVVDLLVIDDFFEVRSTYGTELLISLASERFANLRPTIWTGNLVLQQEDAAWSEVAQRFGVGFSRRLRDGGKNYTLVIT